MSREQSHPLLNEQEFKNAIFKLGYDRSFATRMLTILSWNANSLLTPERDATSLVYSELNPEGVVDMVVSVRGIQVHLSQLETVNQFGPTMVEAAAELVESYED